jgi:Rieske Fe-S protein
MISTFMNNQNGASALQRRQFVKTIFLGMVTSAFGGAKWARQIVAEAKASDVPFPAGQFSFRVSDYPALSFDKGSISLEIPDLPNILVTRMQAGEFVAVTSVCTHEGCMVQPYDPEFGGLHCPCHHSVYTPDGNVIRGPAPRPLYRYNLRRLGDLVTLELVKFSYEISAQLAPIEVRGRKRLGISFDSEERNNYAVMFKPSLSATDWTQVQFSETPDGEASEDLFMGTGDSITLYVEMPERLGIFTVARYHLLGA